MSDIPYIGDILLFWYRADCFVVLNSPKKKALIVRGLSLLIFIFLLIPLFHFIILESGNSF